jgi:hypothetical protein
MPTLELGPEGVGPNRTRLAIYYLQSVMYWPDPQADAGQRAEWMKTGMALFIGESIGGVPAAARVNGPSEWLEWHRAALDAMPPRSFVEQVEQAFRHGVFAGELLGGAVQELLKTGGQFKLGALKAAMTSSKRRKSHKYLDISNSTLDNTIWKRYRSVAHLWASYAYYVLHVSPHDLFFPCRLERLPDFLALAEFFARAGLAAPMQRRSGNERLLDSDHLWHIPAGLPLGRYEV